MTGKKRNEGREKEGRKKKRNKEREGNAKEIKKRIKVVEVRRYERHYFYRILTCTLRW